MRCFVHASRLIGSEAVGIECKNIATFLLGESYKAVGTVGKINRRILIVDDNIDIHHDFGKILCGNRQANDLAAQEAMLFGGQPDIVSEASFQLSSAMQGQDAVQIVADADYEDQPFAVAFVDMRMPPGWGGVETIQHLWEIDPRINIVICTAYSDYTSGQILKELGETDQLLILKKPFDPEEARFAALAMSHKWQQQRIAERKTADLEQELALRTAEIVQSRDMFAFGLAKLADSRDPETGEHLNRMRHYSQMIAEQLQRDSVYSDQIDQAFLDDLYRSSPLHDIGKIGIRDNVLCKPGRLTETEFDHMRQHVQIGADAINEMVDFNVSGSFMKMALDIVRFHHERFDGNGYLAGLAGDEIPLSARIVAIADVYDAITSKRVYKEAMSFEFAYSEITTNAGTQFDPVCVDAFCSCREEFERLADELHRVDYFVREPSKMHAAPELYCRN